MNHVDLKNEIYNQLFEHVPINIAVIDRDHKLVLIATAPVWIKIKRGDKIQNFSLYTGDRKIFIFKEELKLFSEDASSLKIIYDGENITKTHPKGVVLNLSLP